MPIDQVTANILTQTVQQLRVSCENITNLLADTPAEPVPDADQRIEILQKNYAEVSNYDRHYSTTRSALTTLLVTVGLLLAHDPLGNLSSAAKCSITGGWAAFMNILYYFPITLLLFLLTVPLNLHFRRLTYACAMLERAIEREVGRIAALPGFGTITLPRKLENLTPPVGYYFRLDLRRAHRALGWPRLDQMTLLLLPAVFEFIAISYFFEIRLCSFWNYYWNYLILLISPIALGLFYLWRLLWGTLTTAEDVAG